MLTLSIYHFVFLLFTYKSGNYWMDYHYVIKDNTVALMISLKNNCNNNNNNNVAMWMVLFSPLYVCV